MTVDQPRETPIGERLLELGWHQGTLFAAPAIKVNYYKASDEDRRPILKERSTKNNERFVVISQDCDIKSTHEPFIEALLCTVESEAFIRKLLDGKSARFFAVNEEYRLVAQAKYRVLLRKELLISLEPESTLIEERRSRFITWLGRRYDRPALPDDIVEQLQKPLERVLIRIKDEQPEILMRFTGAVHEVRISPSWTAEPPYHMQLVVLIRGDRLSEDEADALSTVTEEMQAAVDGSYILLDTPRFVTEDNISLREYRATSPIFLEYLTYEGDEIYGAEPLRAT